MIPSRKLFRIDQRFPALFAQSPKSKTDDGLEGPAPGRPMAPIIRFLVTQIALGMVLATTSGWLVMHLRERALAAAEHHLHSISLVLADQAERAFEAVELEQNAILERFDVGSMRTPEDFRQGMSSVAVHEDFRSRSGTLPQLDAITAIDAEGNLINFSRSWPIPRVNVADRDYFKALTADPKLTTFMSQPVQNRGNGVWTMYLARKAVGPDGAFLGMILGAIRLGYFEQLYQAVAVGPGSAISMFRRDGVLMARYPHNDLQIGQAYHQRLVFMRPEAAGKSSIVMRQQSVVDGEEKLLAAFWLVHFPVVVNVMDGVSSILGEWRKQAVSLAAAAILIELVVSAIGLLMLKQSRDQRTLNEARADRASARAELTVARERQRADHELGVQNLRFGAALRNMSQALLMFDAADRLIVANVRVAEMFGMSPDSIKPGATIEALFGAATDAAALQQTDVDLLRGNIQDLKANGRPTSSINKLADGRTLAQNFVPMEREGWLVTLEDITERRLAEAKITHMAHHDALTGLPNRVLFHNRLAEAVSRGQRGEASAVLYLDLDHFKAVNDTLGHPIGDALLQEVSIRLRRQVREIDTVARLGGDEFAIVQSIVEKPQDATALAERLIGALCLPYELDGQHVSIGTSIGIALVPDDGENPDELLKKADIALYSAKAEGRGRYHFFEPAMDALMQERRALELDLRRALAAGEFEVYYQPLMNIKTRSVSGFEALLRWQHPERGVVSPLQFVPLAEEIGLIIPLGRWVLKQACLDAASWPGAMKVAVNVSVIQFDSHTLVEDVAAALAESGLAPSRLELEITETVMLADTDAILVILHQLRDLGIGIAMDDFGTGYSSLNYLRRFPFSKVKIDRSFIEGLGRGDECDAIVAAVTELCETLGMTTLAEGVETEEQLRQLRTGNCGEAQGFLFSPPRPASEVAALCRSLTQTERMVAMV
jgi:diguanylate cyclase (GGDEF)-like protein